MCVCVCVHRSFLKYLNDYGMCLVTGVPAREQEVKKVTARADPM